MSTFYFGGIEKASTARAIGLAGGSGMMSYLQYSDNLMLACDEYNLKLVMDCGAFTKPMNDTEIEKYAALIMRLQDRFEWYASPDKIGDQEQSNKNYDYLLTLLPEHLHEHILWIYQYGSDLSYLTDALMLHKRIGIGGLVPIIRADRANAMQTILGIARIVQQYGVQAHFFGLSVASIIEELHHVLPDFSVDSTTWLTGARYGLLINSRGQQHSASDLGYDFSREAILDQNIRTMQKWIDPPANVQQQNKGRFTQMSFFDEVAS